MQGVLKSVNGNMVQIDSKYYTAIKPEYVPKEMNVQVEFSTDPANPTILKFIKVSDGTVKPRTGTGVIHRAPAAGTTEAPKATGYTPKTYGKSPEEQNTIKRQAIGHMVSRTLIGTTLAGAALEAEIRRLYVLYQEIVG